MTDAVRQALSAVALLFATLQAGMVSSAERPVPSNIRFFVYYTNSQGLTVGRPDVEVSRVGSPALERLGKTDASGEVTLAASDLFKPQSVALLFCDPQFKEICAAVRVDTQFLQGFEEFNVQLPVFRLLDRVRVTPR